jgi:capsular polysaccharide biosynthesis protein
VKRLLYFAAKLYPPRWRERYGTEFEALLSEEHFGLKDWLDVWKGALAMRLRGSGVITAIFLAAGTLAGGFVSWRIPERYSSTATLLVQGPNPASTAEAVRRLVEASQSLDSLSEVIQGSRGDRLLEPLVSKLRTAIRVDLAPSTNANWTTLRITFQDRDRNEAAREANALTERMILDNLRWAYANAQRGVTSQSRLVVLAPAAVSPRPMHRDRLRIIGWGCVIGLGIGLFLAWFWPQLPRQRRAS